MRIEDTFRVAEYPPPLNRYVLVRYTGGNWRDSEHQAGCVWKVMKYRNRSGEYCFEPFGPGSWPAEDFDIWAHLPGEE